MPESSADTRQRRRVVTAEGLGVDPALLGRRLASPGQRLAAMAIDLVFVAALTNAPAVALAAAVAGAVLWLFLRRARGLRSWLWRVPAGLLTAAVAALFVLAIVDDGPSYSPSSAAWGEFGEAMASPDPEARQRALEVLQAELEESRDLVLEHYGTADPEAEDGTRERELRRQVLELVRENHDLREQVENPSLLRTVQALAGDLGLELGWAGVYFLLFPALWRGRTPGKRLLRLCIVRLDAGALTPWNAFERLGGYAAGLATGMLGFLQILWDPNRQGVHDKIVGTVVVVDGPAP
jgi:RDD family